MDVAVSVVVPVYNGASTLEACLRALQTQALREPYEVIVIDDGSTDATAEIAARYNVRLISQPNAGAPAARNRGIAAARGTWVAFTDADCTPSRNWLARLLTTVRSDTNAFGAAGRIAGHLSETPAARFVDSYGGLDAQRTLAHPRFPWAPSGNLMYRRDALQAVGGYDERYATFDACDLHTRLLERFSGTFPYEPAALVLHRHRGDWRAYWKQQFFYGVGYAQFLLRHRDKTHWSAWHEVTSVARVIAAGVAAVLPAGADGALVRRGMFVRQAAQHAGFVRTYFSLRERRRW